MVAARRLTVLPPLSRQCGILNTLQPYRPPRPVSEKALLLCSYLTGDTRMGPHGLLQEYLYFYVRNL
jgi:hypothetical protein